MGIFSNLIPANRRDRNDDTSRRDDFSGRDHERDHGRDHGDDRGDRHGDRHGHDHGRW
ncbi:hypothetical protein [Streptomyces incanus]|uniref:Uncharacterized protein n=1 Tax=Streptomyces incanus TaxID=887453 RepID=A0ABW0XM53_9ACTN